VIRVLIQPAVTSFGSAITIYDQPSGAEDYGPRRGLRLSEGSSGQGTARAVQWEDVKVHEQFEPTLILEDDLLRPLCDALVRYFTGTEDTRQLRCDYEAERRRTDKLIDHIATIARSLAEPQP